MKNTEHKNHISRPIPKKGKGENLFFNQKGQGDFFSGNSFFGETQTASPFFTPTNPVQRVEVPQEEETTQLKTIFESEQHPVQKVSNNSNNTNQNNANQSENNTGMPDDLKAGVEGLSGVDMSDVKVHYNSDKPAELNAHAYAQGTDIHLAPGEEKHLPHEAWHVAQQKQGRVQPTTQMQGAEINDDKGLENEADIMGERALQLKREENQPKSKASVDSNLSIIQRLEIEDVDWSKISSVKRSKGGATGGVYFITVNGADYVIKLVNNPEAVQATDANVAKFGVDVPDSASIAVSSKEGGLITNKLKKLKKEAGKEFKKRVKTHTHYLVMAPVAGSSLTKLDEEGMKTLLTSEDSIKKIGKLAVADAKLNIGDRMLENDNPGNIMFDPGSATLTAIDNEPHEKYPVNQELALQLIQKSPEIILKFLKSTWLGSDKLKIEKLVEEHKVNLQKWFSAGVEEGMVVQLKKKSESDNAEAPVQRVIQLGEKIIEEEKVGVPVKLKNNELDKVLKEIQGYFKKNEEVGKLETADLNAYFDRLQTHLETARNLHHGSESRPELLLMYQQMSAQLTLGSSKEKNVAIPAYAPDFSVSDAEKAAYKADIQQGGVWGGIGEADAIGRHFGIHFQVFVVDGNGDLQLRHGSIGNTGGQKAGADILFVGENHFEAIFDANVGDKREDKVVWQNQGGGDCLYYALIDIIESTENKAPLDWGAKSLENKVTDLRNTAHANISDASVEASVRALKFFGDNRALGDKFKDVSAIKELRNLAKEDLEKVQDVPTRKKLASLQEFLKKRDLDVIYKDKRAKRQLAAALEAMGDYQKASIVPTGKISSTATVLSAMSRIVRGYGKSVNKQGGRMATQEVQAMLMDDKVLITANEANTTGAIAKLLAGKKSPKEFIAAWKQMYDEGLANVKSKSAEEEKIKPEDFNIVAAWIYQHTDTLSGKGGKVNVGQIDRPGVKNDLDELQFIIVHGQSVDKDIHAEQTLLALLAAQLKEGKLPQEVHVAGTKMPCSTCFDVLQANYEALKKHYPSVSFFVGDHWTKNNMGNDDVLKLHQTGLIPEDDPQKGNVYNQYRKDFVELQKKVYKPKKK